ncbi:OmpA family protein [Allonocardiopsis opalescens]|uniref:Outer membrane protein OmpA-like peptidoglycan-associated protein n=1 Tax=Allonocardiopsis opalescens TaxID=1144618 RepID=A0A2T0QAR1_9ACTN|nr:OmpA family protein [Allonocardiopsis opalescens]PRY00944.1 outer membrane protein OmpA-like peptidoglycan-associated protein [Allonocardiopsis opalescens]
MPASAPLPVPPALRRPRAGLLGAAAVLALLLAGCVPAGNRAGGADPSAASAPPAPAEGFVREGDLGWMDNASPGRIEILAVEREPDSTALRFRYTPLGEESAPPRHTFGVLGWHGLDTTLSGFSLIDAVGQRRYRLLFDGEPQIQAGNHLGSRQPNGLFEWVPEVEYDLVAYFPRLPEDLGAVTVVAPGNIGPFTGVPVTDVPEPEPVPSLSETPFVDWRPDSEERPAPGERVTLPVVDGPVTAPEEDVAELFGVTETVVQNREVEADTETVALRADVLFDFDEATLTDGARGVLAEVIEETRRRADPERPPITIVGHTDGIGEDAYNQDLSERRAEAVRELLAAELGPEFAYESEGRGSEDPVATEGGDDDSEARARNRRVEISYHYRETTTSTASPTTVQPTAGATGDVQQHLDRAEEGGEPAPFRPGPGEPAATRTVTLQPWGNAEETTYRLDVYPFFRDGAFLVATFDFTVVSGEDLNPGTNSTDHFGYRRGAFDDFAAFDPATGITYRHVQIGATDGRDENEIGRVGTPAWPVHLTAGAGANRGFFYLPAPPPEVTALHVNAGEFGLIEDVPIQQP